MGGRSWRTDHEDLLLDALKSKLSDRLDITPYKKIMEPIEDSLKSFQELEEGSKKMYQNLHNFIAKEKIAQREGLQRLFNSPEFSRGSLTRSWMDDSLDATRFKHATILIYLVFKSCTEKYPNSKNTLEMLWLILNKLGENQMVAIKMVSKLIDLLPPDAFEYEIECFTDPLTTEPIELRAVNSKLLVKLLKVDLHGNLKKLMDHCFFKGKDISYRDIWVFEIINARYLTLGVHTEL